MLSGQRKPARGLPKAGFSTQLACPFQVHMLFQASIAGNAAITTVLKPARGFTCYCSRHTMQQRGEGARELTCLCSRQ